MSDQRAGQDCLEILLKRSPACGKEIYLYDGPAAIVFTAIILSRQLEGVFIKCHLSAAPKGYQPFLFIIERNQTPHPRNSRTEYTLRDVNGAPLVIDHFQVLE